MKGKSTKIIDEVFKVSIFAKGLFALTEVIGGILFLFVSPMFVINTVTFLTRHELTQDPRDILANYFLRLAHQFSISTTEFVGLYLLVHGIIKFLLIVALLKKKLWAYPLSLIVFGLFILYQMYRYSYSNSIFLIFISVFDLAVMWLIWKEYEMLKSKVV